MPEQLPSFEQPANAVEIPEATDTTVQATEDLPVTEPEAASNLVAPELEQNITHTEVASPATLETVHIQTVSGLSEDAALETHGPLSPQAANDLATYLVEQRRAA